MKKVMMIEESLYEFAKRGRPRKNKNPIGMEKIVDDEGEVIDDLDDIDISDMTGEDEIEIEEDVFDDELLKALSNEIKLPEFNRRMVKFRIRGDLGKVVIGVPMAKMSGDAFLFKMKDGPMKKVYLKDMILEGMGDTKSNRARTII